MLRAQHDKFMEKKVRRTSKDTKSVSDRDAEKTITITILIAIVILAGLLIYLALEPAQKKPFAAIYYLDSEKQTENFPETVVLGENNTFTLWVGVENQNDTSMDYSVLVKMDDGNSPIDPSFAEPIESFEKTLLDKEVWEFEVTLSIDQLGSHRIIFELWFLNGTTLEYTGNWVNLSIEAT